MSIITPRFSSNLQNTVIQCLNQLLRCLYSLQVCVTLKIISVLQLLLQNTTGTEQVCGEFPFFHSRKTAHENDTSQLCQSMICEARKQNKMCITIWATMGTGKHAVHLAFAAVDKSKLKKRYCRTIMLSLLRPLAAMIRKKQNDSSKVCLLSNIHQVNRFLMLSPPLKTER